MEKASSERERMNFMNQNKTSTRIIAAVLGVIMVISMIPQISYAYTENNSKVVKGKSEVSFGSQKAYDVTAEVKYNDGVITDVLLMNNAEESGHADSKSFADKAGNMAQKFEGIGIKDKKSIEDVDEISGATITSEAYKKAVLNALNLDSCSDFHYGSAGTVLSPGIYHVPVSLCHADKHENPSLAEDVFPAMVKLIIDKDGTATIEATMGAVKKAGLFDMAQNIRIYQEDNCNSDTVNAEVLETVKNPEGVFRPDPDKDKVVPSKISFKVPDRHLDGVYLSLWVDAMNTAPDAWLRIDYAGAELPGAVKHYHGSAKVNQFGKYTIHTDVSVTDGEISNVDITADNFVSTTHRSENEMKIAQVKENMKSLWNGIAPTKENAEKIFKKIMREDDPDTVIEGITGATYSGKAVRDAVMDAFSQ